MANEDEEGNKPDDASYTKRRKHPLPQANDLIHSLGHEKQLIHCIPHRSDRNQYHETENSIRRQTPHFLLPSQAHTQLQMISNPERAMDSRGEKYSATGPTMQEIELFVAAPHERCEDIVFGGEEEEERKLGDG
jgi:hypothetical protein